MVRSLVAAAAVIALCSCAAPDRRQETPAAHSGSDLRTVRILARASRPALALQEIGGELLAKGRVRIALTLKQTTAELIAELEHDDADGAIPYDLAVVPHRFLGRLAQDGVVIPIDASARTDAWPLDADAAFFPGWWRSTAFYDGRPYGYPFAARSMSLWIRGEFWDEADADEFFRTHDLPAGPPRTWEAFERQAAFQHGREAGRSGTVLVGAADDDLWSLWLQFATAFGARILDAPGPDQYGDIVVNSPEAVRATELYLRLLRLGPEGAATFTMDDALRAFQSGKVAMGVMWHDLAPRMDDHRESAAPMRTAYERVPVAAGNRQKTLLETDLMVVPARSEHRDAALEVMRWALSHPVQRHATLSGGFSARPSVYEDPAVARHLLRHMWSYPQLVTEVEPLPSIPETDRIARLMASELALVLSGTVQPRPALDRMAAQIHALLGGKAALRFPPAP